MSDAECMNDADVVMCCGRPATVIGVDDDLTLHSCPGCGRHAWRRGDQEVDREQVLAALRVAPGTGGPRKPAARRSARRGPVPRGELEDLLSGFTVHGESS